MPVENIACSACRDTGYQAKAGRAGRDQLVDRYNAGRFAAVFYLWLDHSQWFMKSNAGCRCIFARADAANP